MAKDSSSRLTFRRSSPRAQEAAGPAWKVLIVDDDPEVHSVTRLVLKNKVFLGRPIELTGAHSAAQARDAMRSEEGIAVILLDVVMEDDDAGLQFVKYVRGELGNGLVRIVLRTGQPGYAPEEDVIVRYDINDYRLKTELTSTRLFTTLIAALRNYHDLTIIEQNKIGLEKILNASRNIFKIQSMNHLTDGILTQLASIHESAEGAIAAHMAPTEDESEDSVDGFVVMAGTGKYERAREQLLSGVLDEAGLAGCRRAIREQRTIVESDRYYGYFQSESGRKTVLFLEGVKDDEVVKRGLVDIFKMNVAIAFDNLTLHQRLEDTQKELIFSLAGMIEHRDKQTGHHVERVAEIARRTAAELGASPDEQELIRVAAATHDVGKIAVPDHVLNKPGRLTEEEAAVMRRHAEIGHAALSGSDRPIFRAAATIALQHHERWDGNGYPQGLAGEAIDWYARITAIADVFDALSSDRVYRARMSEPEVERFIRDQRGAQFDPRIVDAFMGAIDDMWRIRRTLR